jgi:plasmid stabilization system protein ParE
MYTLIWGGRALDQLADIYVALPLDAQRQTAAAVDAMNHRLTERPHEEGESRGGNLRITFPDALVVRFRVDEIKRTVRVTNVKRSVR